MSVGLLGDDLAPSVSGERQTVRTDIDGASPRALLWPHAFRGNKSRDGVLEEEQEQEASGDRHAYARFCGIVLYSFERPHRLEIRDGGVKYEALVMHAARTGRPLASTAATRGRGHRGGTGPEILAAAGLERQQGASEHDLMVAPGILCSLQTLLYSSPSRAYPYGPMNIERGASEVCVKSRMIGGGADWHLLEPVMEYQFGAVLDT